ncbi:MAG TPA: MBL fold metallo-hydrolase, partial [Flavobacteriaceae bacterium]|nr:MBL fold metallo-hydrolase [Flavobacteriaceae bacterium]
MRKSIFGKSPSGERLEQIKQSPNYTDGSFQNLSETPQLAEGYSMGGVLYNYLFKKKPRLKPKGVIPSVHTDIKAISPNEEVLLWFGHSSYYMQLEGLRILVDPVFSGNASPIPGTTKS